MCRRPTFCAERAYCAKPGHAIVACALRNPIIEVALAPHPHLRVRQVPRSANAAIIALAGDIAEQRACPGSEWDCDIDDECARDVAQHLNVPLEHFRGKAQAILNRYWCQVETVAGALLADGTLSGKQVAEIVSPFMTPVEVVAVHEAAHAVVALATGCLITGVEILPRAELRMVGKPIARAMVALAGSIAQLRAFPTSGLGEAGDMEIAVEAASHFSGRPRHLIRHLQTRTRRLLTQRWHHVDAIAVELLARSRLSGAEIAASIG